MVPAARICKIYVQWSTTLDKQIFVKDIPRPL